MGVIGGAHGPVRGANGVQRGVMGVEDFVNRAANLVRRDLHVLNCIMPKRLKQPADPDPIPPSSKAFRAYMKILGRKGGQVSGARRMTNRTPKQRQALARKAARARWAKKKLEETS